jgi:hypothetical protein
LKAQTFIEPIRSLILQSDRKRNLLVLLVRAIDRVSQETGADSTVLITWLNLDLANLYAARVIE